MATKRKSTKKLGRPSKKTEEVCEEICERLSEGEPLAAICRDAHMPDRTVVWDWRQADDDFSQRIAQARDDGFDRIAEDCLRIADDLTDDPASRRVRVETRLKLLAKWDPKRYGDKLELSGGETPLRVVIGGDA